MAKITPQMRDRIMVYVDQGEISNQEIADIFHVSPSTICNVKFQVFEERRKAKLDLLGLPQGKNPLERQWGKKMKR